MTWRGAGSGICDGTRMLLYGAAALILVVIVWFFMSVQEHGWNTPEAMERMRDMTWARGGQPDYYGNPDPKPNP